MSRSIVLSNGELCVALDRFGEIRDVYYPHVGQEDHVRGHYVHRVGVWIDGAMSWLSEDTRWDITVECQEESLESIITARHEELKVELVFRDVVYNEKPVFLRRVTVTNGAETTREIKVYFAQQFEIYKAHGGDTAYYDPVSHTIIHYKGRRVFLMTASLDEAPFSDYATGLANIQGKEGSHRDAEDGALSKNPIEHGQVDSIIGLYSTYAPHQSRTIHYAMIAGRSIEEALELHQMFIQKGAEHLWHSTTDYWKAWLHTYPREFHGLTPEQIALFYTSLMYMRSHVDVEGGVIASVDSDMLEHGMDTYSYVWPRDAAYTALALDHVGDTNLAKHFFEFCNRVMGKDGYLMHKYLPDGSLGSSWHPWIRNGHIQLPIQEDETALVVIGLYEHYKYSRDVEFLETMYESLVERTADFMLRYRHPETKLPEPSYDLWEEKRGCTAFTASTVYGALIAAAEMSKVLGKLQHEEHYRTAAHEVQEAVLKYLWDNTTGMFVKMINYQEGVFEYDKTVDVSSVYGVFAYGVLPASDDRLVRAFETTARVLSHGIAVGGLARYDRDDYFRNETVSSGNPWITTTLWYAEFLIANAHSEQDLDRVREIFNWVVRYAQPSGVLSEQIHPQTGEQLSATPLTWSHAGYVSAVLKYLDRVKELKLA